MQRRQVLALVTATGTLGTAGCLGSSTEPEGSTTAASDSTTVRNGNDGDGEGEEQGEGTDTDASPLADSTPADLVDGETYYVGQTLQREDGVESGETLDVGRRGTDDSSLIFADDEGTLRIDTTDLEPGNYVLSDSVDDTVSTFRLVEQTYAVSVDPATVTNGGSDGGSDGGADGETSVEISSNREGYRHAITVTRDGDALDAGVIDSVIDADGTRHDVDGDGTDEALVLDGGDPSQTLVADFAGQAPGSYALHFDVPDTTAAATATVTVEDPASGQASLATRTLSAPRGEVLSIPVTLTNTDEAELQIGSRNVNYLVTATVEDGDGDGTVDVRWDTALAGQAADEADAWSAAANADAVTDVSRSTGQLGGPLALQSYSISLRVDGTETGLGLATLTEPTTTSPPPTTGVILELDDFEFEEGTDAARWDFTVPEQASVAIEVATETRDPMAWYVMPASAEENYWNGSEFEYVEALSFPLTHSGSGQTTLDPGEYVVLIAYPNRQGYTEGTTPAVVDLLLEYV